MAKARDLYCGRAFSEAAQSADDLRAQFWIISAGLGLVEAESEVPAYNLTISPKGADSVVQKVSPDTWSHANWWAALSKSNGNEKSLSALVSQQSNSVLLIALSEAYGRLIESELVSLPDNVLERVRLFGLRLSEVLNPRLEKCVMPYDARLDIFSSAVTRLGSAPPAACRC